MEKRNNVFINKVEDFYVMTTRSVRHIFRNVDTLIMTAIVPIMILLVFTYLFGGAIDTELNIDYIKFVVPGILILCVGYSASTTAVNINSDFKKGIIDRFRSMPIARSSFLVGHILSGLMRNILTTTIVIGVAFLMGFRSNAGFGDWLIAIFILIFFALTVTTLAAMFGILASTPDGAGIFGFVMMFLPYLSSAFVPIESMPKVIQGFSTYQPISVIIDTIKYYLLGIDGGNLLVSIIWCGSITVVSLVVSVILFIKKTAK